MKSAFTFALFALLASSATPVQASTVFSLDQDACTGTCGTGPLGTVELVQMTATTVRVTVTLGPSSWFVRTGAGESLGFNISGNKTVDITGLSSGFIAGPTNYKASALGNFEFSVRCSVCQGGNATNPAGPMAFTVGYGSGLSISDFITNSKGYYFASDLRGNNGNTGNVGSLGFQNQSADSPVPEPLTLVLTGAGIVGMLVARRRMQAKVVAG